MYLGYYQGKLVSASNALRSAEQMRAAALAALTAGRKGEALPENFSFNGRDNTLLDGIHENMSLLRGAA